MAVAKDLDFTYSLTDRVIRLSLGELPDFSGAKFDGDFSLSLEEAQRRKHDYVSEQIGIGPGRRILDLGCGWGPLLAYARERGAEGVGVTLSSAQLDACREHGLTYSRFISGLLKAGIDIDRKVLSDLAIHEPAAFKALVDQASA